MDHITLWQFIWNCFQIAPVGNEWRDLQIIFYPLSVAIKVGTQLFYMLNAGHYAHQYGMRYADLKFMYGLVSLLIFLPLTIYIWILPVKIAKRIFTFLDD